MSAPARRPGGRAGDGGSSSGSAASGGREAIDPVAWVSALADVALTAFAELLPAPVPGESQAELAARRAATEGALRDQVVPSLQARRRDHGEAPLTAAQADALVVHCLGRLFAVAGLEDLLDDPTVTDIWVRGASPVRVSHLDGREQTLAPLVRRPADLERLIAELAARHRRPYSEANGRLQVTLGPGVRLVAVGGRLAGEPVLTVRRPVVRSASLEALAAKGTMPVALARFLGAAVRAGASVLVTGEMGAGKTTFLRAALGELGPSERVVTVETVAELHLSDLVGLGCHVVAELVEDPGWDDHPAVRAVDLMGTAVKLSASRIVVGEVVGAEAVAFVEATTVGTGGLATVHGRTAERGVGRLVELVRRHGGLDRAAVVHDVHAGVDLVVHLAGDNRSGRHVSEVLALEATTDGEPVLHRLWGSPRPGSAATTLFPPPPDLVAVLEARGEDTAVLGELWPSLPGADPSGRGAVGEQGRQQPRAGARIAATGLPPHPAAVGTGATGLPPHPAGAVEGEDERRWSPSGGVAAAAGAAPSLPPPEHAVVVVGPAPGGSGIRSALITPATGLRPTAASDDDADPDDDADRDDDATGGEDRPPAWTPSLASLIGRRSP